MTFIELFVPLGLCGRTRSLLRWTPGTRGRTLRSSTTWSRQICSKRCRQRVRGASTACLLPAHGNPRATTN